MNLRAAAICLCWLLLFSSSAAAQDGAPIVDPAPPLPDAYLVLFAPDSIEIDDAGKHALAQVLQDYGVNKPSIVYVDGYYDRTGTEDYALQMSKRMAEVVRDYLAAHGVIADSIKLAWHGESEPLVLTEDGVAEAANRSVEIRFTAKRNPLRP